MSGSPQRTSDPEAIKLLAKLDGVCRQLEADEAKVGRTGATRGALFVQLRDMGVTQSEIAEHAKISENAVGKAIRKAIHDRDGHEGFVSKCEVCAAA